MACTDNRSCGRRTVTESGKCSALDVVTFEIDDIDR